MIQEIGPKIFDNHFKNKTAETSDLFLSYEGDTILIHEGKEKLWYPSFADFQLAYPNIMNGAQYLFSIDDMNYFLVDEQGLDSLEGWVYVSINRFRSETKYWRSFAGVVGLELKHWYDNHGFCSRCGKLTVHSDKERMLYCESCGFQTYPTISPCVIVGVHNQNRLLLTKYAGRPYTNYALIAGFVEIGETLEQAVRREVKEEVGLCVKNLKYYKSQPWPFTDTLLVGFFAELKGDDTIVLQEDELSLGLWIEKEDIPPSESKISLTSDMMEAYRNGLADL
ncbi:MAG: NAD(+) diphosphatase [Clostridia bacterium]|nr:NAD(+) diphosphatase [Clostridia bacterium]